MSNGKFENFQVQQNPSQTEITQGFVIPPNVQFNINVAGMSTFQNSQTKQLKGGSNGFMTVQNPGLLTREKIEL